MSETRVPAIPTPTDSNLREVARAIKGVLDVREGLVGDPLDSAVKFRDLVDAGVVQVSLQRRGGGAAGLVVVPAAPDSGYDPTTDLNPPPAPQGFSVTGLFAAVQLSWQLPAIGNYAYTEIWRSSTNALGSAVRIATTPAAIYSDFIGNSATRYYWVRFVTQADVAGPYNATEGTLATTSQDPAFLLGLLTEQLTETQLYQTLQDRINLIDGSGTGSVNARIAAEAFARGQAIAAEALSRLSGDQGLQDQINLLSAGTSGDLSALITAVNNETLARIAADLSESDARALADTTLNTAIDAEEVARAVADGVLSAIAAALGASVEGVSAAIRQESDTRAGADSAAASQTLALQAQVNGAAGALVVEQEVRALADTVATTQVVTLAARVDLGDAQNAAGLVIEQQARADADGALSGQVVSLAASAGDGRAALRVEQEVRASETAVLALQTATLAVADGAAAAGLAVEQQARVDADGAAASQTASLAATAAGLQAAITTESSVRATDDAATATQVTTLASRVDVGDSSNAAAIQAEQSTRADADSAQAAQTQVLSAAASDNASAIRTERDARADETQALASQSQTIGATAGAALAGLVVEQSARADADSAAASQAQQLAARLGESVAGLAAEQAVSVERDSALATQTTQLVAAVGQAAAGLVEERSVRAAGDVVVADQVTGLAARLGDGAAGIQEERLARVTADEAVGRQLTTIAADLGGNAAGIQAEQQARASADVSVANQLTLLVAKTDDTAAALVTETLTRANETSAIAATATRLATQFASGALLPFDFSTGKAEWTNATGGSPSAVTQPSGTVITNDPDFGACLEITDFDTVGEALLTRQVVPATQGKVYRIVTRLKIVSSDGSIQLGHLAAGLLGDYSLVGTSNLGTTTISGAALGDGSLNGAGAGNVTLSGTGVFTISSMASSSSGAQFGAWPAGSAWVRLGVRLGTSEAGLVVRVGSIRIEEVTASAGLAMEAFTRSTQDDALSKQVLTLSSEVGNTSAALQVASTTQASSNAALASQVTTLQASAAGNTAAIQAEAFVRASETGALGAKYAIKVDVNGYVSGFGLASEANNGAPVSTFGIRADSFFIASPDGPGISPSMPFIARTTGANPGVYLRDAFIENGTITRAKIEDLAVDNAKIADLNVDKLNGSELKVGAFIQSTNFVSGANGTGWRINADGTAELQAAFIRGRVTASQIDGANLEINAAGVELGANVGPGGGHSGLSLSADDFNNIFLRRESDGVVFFRINKGGDQSLTFDSSSGILSIRGSINGGSYTGYAWPASGTGFHLGPSGLLLGNANTGRYFQVGANGDVYAPGFSIVGGSATFSGTLSAAKVSVGAAGSATSFVDPAYPSIVLRSAATGHLAFSGSTGFAQYIQQTCYDSESNNYYDCSYYIYLGEVVTGAAAQFTAGVAGAAESRRIRTGLVRFLVNASATAEHYFTIWYRRGVGGSYGSWAAIATAIENQASYGATSVSGAIDLTVAANEYIQFGMSATDSNLNYWSMYNGRVLNYANMTVQAINF